MISKQALLAAESVIRELANSHFNASNLAYANRHTIRWVELGVHTHERLAEAFQIVREYRWENGIFRDPEHDPRRRRGPDGRAPSISDTFGLPVRLGGYAEGIVWDVGTPPSIPWPTWEAS